MTNEASRPSPGSGSTSLGVAIPTTGSLPLALGIAEMSQAAEESGAHSLWVSDHLLMVASDASRYPYSRDGRITWPLEEDYFEALVSCCFIAAATTRARVGTAVLVLPQRNALELAKLTASIDQFSGGRFVLGVGAGWNVSEMQALGYDFGRRGDRMDEMIQVLRFCWTGRPEPFPGKHVQLPDGLIFFPKPVRSEGPPILVGGMSRPALRRAARFGDGWLGLAFADRFARNDLVERLQLVEGLRHQYRQDVRFRTVIKVHTRPEESQLIPRLVRECQDIGFDEVIIQPPWARGVKAATEAIEGALAIVSQ